MDDRAIRDLQIRLGRLERECVRLRQGEMTADDAVALGGSSTSFDDVAVLGGFASSGDRVSVLTAGNDALVLGGAGSPFPGIAFGQTTITGTGARSATKVINHGLSGTPTAVFITAGLSTHNGASTSYTSTQFTAVLNHLDNIAWSSAVDLYWLALKT